MNHPTATDHAFEERVAICMVQAHLPANEAYDIAISRACAVLVSRGITREEVGQ